MRRSSTQLLTGLLACGLSLGCGTSGGDDTEAEASFGHIYGEILANPVSCGSTSTACHGTGSEDALLDFSSEDAAYAGLVGRPAQGRACATSGLDRVVPGDPDGSLLVNKLEGLPPCGDPMPVGGRLDTGQLGRIRSWIAAGAARD